MYICVCTYVYTYENVDIVVHTLILIQIWICIYSYLYIHIYGYVYVHICIYIYTCREKDWERQRERDIQKDIHVKTHICTHDHVQATNTWIDALEWLLSVGETARKRATERYDEMCEHVSEIANWPNSAHTNAIAITDACAHTQCHTHQRLYRHLLHLYGPA